MRFGLIGGGRAAIRTVRGRSGALLPSFERRFGRDGLRDVAGVCVVEGPGSFSSVRGGVVVADVLARCLDVPLAGIDVAEASDLARLAERLQGGEVPLADTVLPRYDAEPNITRPSPRPSPQP
ncbi:hypothetical protein L0Y59_04245 [Candidatus Uhrbacteria bacterium]|nr:hypothetical protein [Candidatus Uhrbacteria bacterium]